MEPGTYCWDEEILQDIFNERDVQLIRSIPNPLQRNEDSWFWIMEESGLFSVKSCRRIQGQQNWVHTDFWKKVWSLELPGKVINFIWRVCKSCLPTVAHVVFDCLFARSVWARVGMMEVKCDGYEENAIDILQQLDFGGHATTLNMMYEWKQNCLEKFKQKVVSNVSARKWYVPQQGWMKVNVDAAVFMEQGYTGIGSVIRNEHGEFVRARNQRLEVL
ncbi:uncharacterized protein LOC141712407 [Apium graveolens]|uniref:uncharacterized protein LOC141712407 n=1 Tax=Apium graveolens TaxID=4045 RepID=UPI003D7AE3C3